VIGKKQSSPWWLVFVLTCALLAQQALWAAPAPADDPGKEAWAAPVALAVSRDGQQLYVACARSHNLLVLPISGPQPRRSIKLPGAPSGLVLSPDGRTLYVTCSAPTSSLVALDITKGKIMNSVLVGHSAQGPSLSPDGTTAYVCNRFNNDLSVVDLKLGKVTAQIAVGREPVASAVTANGKLVLVANNLHNDSANAESVAASVTIIDATTRTVLRQLRLPNGSGMLRDICVSPDGRYACVTHLIARFKLLTIQVEKGWMNRNVCTLIDLSNLEIVNTVLLDNAERGAANPWACGWSADGRVLFVTHAGTHELSLIDFPGLLAKLSSPAMKDSIIVAGYGVGTLQRRERLEVSSDLAFLTGLRQRVQLKGKGPRAAAIQGSRIFVASYFSDQVEVVDLDSRPSASVELARLTPEEPISVLRRGEFWFNDASICLQGWQSCASCHSDDARVDGLNWDLLNDGVGNPKNTKSLLLSHRTPPVMSLGVRETAESAVRAGIRGILFTAQPEEVPLAIDEWLKSLTPIPSPYLEDQKLSPQARRGERLFNNRATHCAACHPQGLYTDLRHYDVGTLAKSGDKAGSTYDTPTLVEIWRTAPYLHDGSAATLREVLVERNPADRHGKTSQLKPSEIDDLVAYLLSL
jgi:YVTN family beta-propeller protein